MACCACNSIIQTIRSASPTERIQLDSAMKAMSKLQYERVHTAVKEAIKVDNRELFSFTSSEMFDLIKLHTKEK